MHGGTVGGCCNGGGDGACITIVGVLEGVNGCGACGARTGSDVCGAGG